MKRFCLLILILVPCFGWGEVNTRFAEQCVRRYADHYRVPRELISALIDVESGWDPRAVSRKGALGLMQLMPNTAERFGAFRPFDVEQNIAAGTRYVTTLMWEFHGDLRLVAAAYYAGDYWIGRKQLNYHNPEVIAYVQAVRHRYQIRKFGEVRTR
jgi:soluble lytic murein transglycosylase-like protein